MKTHLAIAGVLLFCGVALSLPVSKGEVDLSCRIVDGVHERVATAEEAAAGFVSLKCEIKGAEPIYYVISPDEFVWRGCTNQDIRLERNSDGETRFGKQAEGCEIIKRPKCTAQELFEIQCGVRLSVNAIPFRP
jgi:hypothetical protein